MAGLEAGNPTPLGRIDPSSLIGQPNQELITPRNTAILTDAFRQGFITADDIKNRISENTRAKTDLETASAKQQLSLLNDPEIQAAQRNVMLAHGARAKATIADTQRAQEIAPLVQQAERAKTIRAIDADQTIGESEKIAAKFQAAGVPLPKTKEGFVDVDSARKTEEDINQWGRDTIRDAAVAASIKWEKRTMADGSEETAPFSEALGRFLNDKEFKDIQRKRTEAPTFTQWKAERDKAAAAAAAPVAPVIQPRAPISPQDAAKVRTDLFRSGVITASIPDSDVQGLLTPQESNATIQRLYNEGTIPPNISVADIQARLPAAGTVAAPAANIEPVQNRTIKEAPTPASPTPAAITDQFRKQKSYEQWNNAKPFYGAMVNTMDEINKIPIAEQRKGTTNLNLQDIELVSNFIKLYDPNAVIREFKWDKIEHSQPIPDQVKNWMSSITREGHLTPETRQQLFKVGTQAFHAKEQSIVPDLQMASKIATDAGYNLEHILTPEESKLLSGGGAHYQGTPANPSLPPGYSSGTVTIGGKKVQVLKDSKGNFSLP